MKLVTDAQWDVIRSLLPLPPSSRRGRPRANPREVFETILFVLMTGIPWGQLPESFPPKSTVYDYFQYWSRTQAFKRLLHHLIKHLAQKGRLDLSVCFVDAMFAPAKRGGQGVGLTKRGKGVKAQVLVDRQGLPMVPRTREWFRLTPGSPRWFRACCRFFPKKLTLRRSLEIRLMMPIGWMRP